MLLIEPQKVVQLLFVNARALAFGTFFFRSQMLPYGSGSSRREVTLAAYSAGFHFRDVLLVLLIQWA